jgi:hypothetical protein
MLGKNTDPLYAHPVRLVSSYIQLEVLSHHIILVHNTLPDKKNFVNKNVLLSSLVNSCSKNHLSQLVFSIQNLIFTTRGSSVSTASDYGLDDREFDPRQKQNNFSSNLCVQTDSGAHSVSYPMVT